MPVYVPSERPEGQIAEALRPGTYHLQAEKAEAGYTNSGGEYVKWTFSVLDDPQYEGQRLYFNSSTQEKAASYPNTGLWAIMDMFDILGEFEDQDMDFEEFCTLLDSVTAGATFYATVKVRLYQGKKQNDIISFAPENAAESDAPEAPAPPPEAEAPKAARPAPAPRGRGEQLAGQRPTRPSTPTTSRSNRPPLRDRLATDAGKGGPPY